MPVHNSCQRSVIKDKHHFHLLSFKEKHMEILCFILVKVCPGVGVITQAKCNPGTHFHHFIFPACPSSSKVVYPTSFPTNNQQHENKQKPKCQIAVRLAQLVEHWLSTTASPSFNPRWGYNNKVVMNSMNFNDAIISKAGTEHCSHLLRHYKLLHHEILSVHLTKRLKKKLVPKGQPHRKKHIAMSS